MDILSFKHRVIDKLNPSNTLFLPSIGNRVLFIHHSMKSEYKSFSL